MHVASHRFRRLLVLAGLALLLARPAAAGAVVTPYVNGLGGGMGQAFHPTSQQLFFLEADTGEFSKVNTATGVVTTLSNAYVHPNDVALYPGTNTAFITTRIGELWRASTVSSARVLITNGLGLPGQLVLDPGSFSAYTVDFASGTLWRVPLGGAPKIAVVSGLNMPRGLIMSADFKTALISEATQVVSVDLLTQAVTPVVTGLTNLWYMAWADDLKTAFYVVDREPANRFYRVSLTTTPATLNAIAAVPPRPSSIVRSSNPDVLYVTSKTVLSKVSLSGGAGGPIITRLGFIPSTEIDPVTGQATTDPSYFFYVKNASFGGTVHVMLNFPGMLAQGAAYYKVSVDGGPALATWSNYKWDPVTLSFKIQTVAPSNGFYAIPPPGEIWATPDLGFALDTTSQTNAKHTVKVDLYDVLHLPLGVFDDVAMLVDNKPPVMEIQQIVHDGQPLNQCALITSGSAQVDITFKAHDAEGHLYNYSLVNGWGSNQSAQVTEDHYLGVHDASPVWSGVNPQTVTYTFSNTACAHSFHLSGWGNTTNGYTLLHYATFTEHVAIYLGGAPCGP